MKIRDVLRSFHNSLTSIENWLAKTVGLAQEVRDNLHAQNNAAQKMVLASEKMERLEESMREVLAQQRELFKEHSAAVKFHHAALDEFNDLGARVKHLEDEREARRRGNGTGPR